MSEKILVPVLGESITEATVSKWLKNEGDKVEADEPIVELETDKVNLEVPSPVSGILSQINSKDGMIVNVGAILGSVTENLSEADNPSSSKSPDISIDENNDELDFAIRGSFDSVTIEIQSNDEVLWTGTAKMTSDIKRFNVPINEFFDGNTESYDGTVVKTYSIIAISSNDITVEQDINSKLLTREATDGGVQFSPYVSISNSGDGAESTYEGVRVQAFVGMFGDGEKAMDDGVHSYASSNQRQFVGQQTYTLSISKRGSSMAYSHPLVTIDGDTAKWTSEYSGAKSSDTAVAFVPLSGTAIDNDGFEYIEKDRFYDGDECYDFTLSVTNVNLGEDHSTSFTVTNSWEFSWETGSSAEERNSYPTC